MGLRTASNVKGNASAAGRAGAGVGSSQGDALRRRQRGGPPFARHRPRKDRAGWDTLAAIQSATRGLADLSYKSAIAVGELPRGHDDTAVDVLPDRLKLPAHAATVPLEQYLSGAVRDGYLRPSSLEFDLLRSAECDGSAGRESNSAEAKQGVQEAGS